MWRSIQDYCKKINSELTYIDILSVFITLLSLVLLTGIVIRSRDSMIKDITYTHNQDTLTSSRPSNNQSLEKPFASKNGKTYTFSWCQGSSRISDKNKLYFTSIEEAEKSGRYLSKLCQK